MVLRSRQKIWQTVAFSWVTLLLLLLFVVILTRGVWGMYQKNARAQSRVQDAAIELAKVETRKASLEKNLAHIKTTQGVEEELRRKFDVSKTGEHLLVIIDKEVLPEEEAAEESWWQDIWRKLTE